MLTHTTHAYAHTHTTHTYAHAHIHSHIHMCTRFSRISYKSSNFRFEQHEKQRADNDIPGYFITSRITAFMELLSFFARMYEQEDIQDTQGRVPLWHYLHHEQECVHCDKAHDSVFKGSWGDKAPNVVLDGAPVLRHVARDRSSIYHKIDALFLLAKWNKIHITIAGDCYVKALSLQFTFLHSVNLMIQATVYLKRK